jgi:hypothetical protein
MKYVANMLRSKGDPQIIETGPSSLTAADNLARGLGWFSVGLGLAELFAATRLARAFGLERSETLIRTFGVREIGAGMATLSTEKKAGLWSRVVGDAMDLMTLLTALDSPPRQKANVKLALLAVAGVTALDVVAVLAISAQQRRDDMPKDMSGRSGYPKGIAASRAAAKDFKVPRDMRAAVGVQSWSLAGA